MSDPASLSPGALPTAQPDPGLAASLETLGGELAADLARKPQGDMATRVEAARLLTEKAAAALERGERADMEAGMAKLFATEAALENATETMRIHGGYGYSKEFLVVRLYRDAPLLCIGEGTNEIQRLLIAKRLIEKNPA